jgi:hypothetical protein
MNGGLPLAPRLVQNTPVTWEAQVAAPMAADPKCKERMNSLDCQAVSKRKIVHDTTLRRGSAGYGAMSDGF